MPIYEYQCSKCHKTIEVMQKMADPRLEDCPECQSTRSLTKILSPTAFVLKGGGWYSDAYSSKAKTGSASTGGTSAASSTESKPTSEAKTEPAPKTPAKPCGSCD